MLVNRNNWVFEGSFYACTYVRFDDACFLLSEIIPMRCRDSVEGEPFRVNRDDIEAFDCRIFAYRKVLRHIGNRDDAFIRNELRIAGDAFACTRRTHEKHPFGDARAYLDEFFRVLQKVDYLKQLALGLLGARDILEGHLLHFVFGIHEPRHGLAERECLHAAPAAQLSREVPDDAEEKYHRHQYRQKRQRPETQSPLVLNLDFHRRQLFRRDAVIRKCLRERAFRFLARGLGGLVRVGRRYFVAGDVERHDGTRRDVLRYLRERHDFVLSRYVLTHKGVPERQRQEDAERRRELHPHGRADLLRLLAAFAGLTRHLFERACHSSVLYPAKQFRLVFCFNRCVITRSENKRW